jgi:hypothetical protein
MSIPLTSLHARQTVTLLPECSLNIHEFNVMGEIPATIPTMFDYYLHNLIMPFPYLSKGEGEKVKVTRTLSRKVRATFASNQAAQPSSETAKYMSIAPCSAT